MHTNKAKTPTANGPAINGAQTLAADVPLQPGTIASQVDTFPATTPVEAVTLCNVRIVEAVTFTNPETCTITRTFAKPGGSTVTGVLFADAVNAGSSTCNTTTGIVTQPVAVVAVLSLDVDPFILSVQTTDACTLSLAAKLPFDKCSCTFPEPSATATFSQTATTVTVTWTVTYDGTTPVTCSICRQRSVDVALSPVPGPGRTEVIQAPIDP